VQIFNHAKPEGGTNPTAIFQNEQAKRALIESIVIIFGTDGEIDNNNYSINVLSLIFDSCLL
jgi:hypothetical protein